MMRSISNTGKTSAPMALGSPRFSGRKEPVRIAPRLMEQLNAKLDKAPQGNFIHQSNSRHDSDVVVSRIQSGNAERPVKIEVHIIQGRRVIMLSPEGEVLEATCAGAVNPRPLALAQAKDMTENLLMRLFPGACTY